MKKICLDIRPIKSFGNVRLRIKKKLVQGFSSLNLAREICDVGLAKGNFRFVPAIYLDNTKTFKIPIPIPNKVIYNEVMLLGVKKR